MYYLMVWLCKTLRRWIQITNRFDWFHFNIFTSSWSFICVGIIGKTIIPIFKNSFIANIRSFASLITLVEISQNVTNPFFPNSTTFYIVPLYVTIHTILICTSQINNNYCFPSILAHRLKIIGLYPLGPSDCAQIKISFHTT